MKTMSVMKRLSAICFLWCSVCVSVGAAKDFEPLFNGRDLSGWKGLDGFWSVQDGVIIGETTSDRKIDSDASAGRIRGSARLGGINYPQRRVR